MEQVNQGTMGKAPVPKETQATGAKPIDTPNVNEASARVAAAAHDRALADGRDPAAERVLREAAERGDAGKPIQSEASIQAEADQAATDSPQTTRGSPGGPPQPATEAQRATVVDAAGQARPDLTAPGGTGIPDGVTRVNQTDPGARGATFAAPGAPVHDKNGPIFRHQLPHGGSFEAGLLDGLLYLTIHPDNGKAASVRLPASAALDLRVALARTDLR